MLAAAALGALGAQLAEIRAAKQDWFVVAGRVDKQDISLEADGAVTVRRQQPFDKALRNFPKMDSLPMWGSARCRRAVGSAGRRKAAGGGVEELFICYSDWHARAVAVHAMPSTARSRGAGVLLRHGRRS